MSELPRVTVKRYYTEYATERNEHGGYDTISEGWEDVEGEVLTVHIEKNSMRVRIPTRGWLRKRKKWETINVSANPFFEKYQIVPR